MDNADKLEIWGEGALVSYWRCQRYLCCQFLSIVHFGLPLWYSLTFI